MSKDDQKYKNALVNRLSELAAERGMSIFALSETAGLARDAIYRVEKRGPQSSLNMESLRRIAAALGVAESDLIEQKPPAPGPAEIRRAEMSQEIQYRSQRPGRYIDVLGTAAGSLGQGAFQLNDGPIDRVSCPPGLIDARGVYAIYVENDSMAPEHRAGDLRFVHPHRPPQIGDTVVVQVKNGSEHEVTAYIKTLEKRTGDRVICTQHNPPARIEFNRAYIVSIHKVLTTNELFGG